MNIVVTGSLGHIGKPLTEHLVQQGHQVTVVSSNPERQKDIENLGAHAAIGSLEDIDFLKSTFKDAEALYCMNPPNFGEQDQVAYYRRIANNYKEAIKESHTKRVVYLSSYGAHLDQGTGIILGSHHSEGILNTLTDVAITHLRPGSFYYNLLGQINMIKQAGFMGANYGDDDMIVWVAPQDIAEAAAEELVKKPAIGSHVRYMASDERTANETARILGAAIGKPGLTWKTFTDEHALKGMLDNGMPKPLAEALVALGASIHKGTLKEDYEQKKPIAMGKVKVEDFAKTFAAAYHKK